MEYQALKSSNVETVRASIRANSYTSHTAGLGQGFLQANLVLLPEEYALDFLRFCQRNPKPCPLIGVSDTGNPHLFTAGRDLDLRTDLPAYNIYRNGKLDRCVSDIRDVWRDDMVAFAIGCSFTFENALIQAGVNLWHIGNNTTVPMFRTNVETVPAGPFRGSMVVSLRMVPGDKVDLVRSICARFPLAHGSPVHWGDPSEIGIGNLAMPDWGDPAPVGPSQIPMFWACGVTPQVAIQNAGVSLCITHKPGHMLITDIPAAAEVPILQ